MKMTDELTYAIRISEGGRVVVPAEVRKALGVAEGEVLVGELRKGAFVLTTRRAQLDAARQRFQGLCPPRPGRSLADELILERRQEGDGADGRRPRRPR